MRVVCIMYHVYLMYFISSSELAFAMKDFSANKRFCYRDNTIIDQLQFSNIICIFYSFRCTNYVDNLEIVKSKIVVFNPVIFRTGSERAQDVVYWQKSTKTNFWGVFAKDWIKTVRMKVNIAIGDLPTLTEVSVENISFYGIGNYRVIPISDEIVASL